MNYDFQIEFYAKPEPQTRTNNKIPNLIPRNPFRTLFPNHP